jgi:hypothetical protein
MIEAKEIYNLKQLNIELDVWADKESIELDTCSIAPLYNSDCTSVKMNKKESIELAHSILNHFNVHCQPLEIITFNK